MFIVQGLTHSAVVVKAEKCAWQGVPARLADFRDARAGNKKYYLKPMEKKVELCHRMISEVR
jgi:hypothetical protein